MSDADFLKRRFPILSRRLRRVGLADLPTPVKTVQISVNSKPRPLSVKYDNLTGSIYGGNKVRKLEYIFPRVNDRHCLRVATFGAVGSNHALATALYAREVGLECTCFLSHQAQTPMVAPTLNAHIRNGTELVRYGGAYQNRLAILRETLWGRHTWVIPMGGSSWLGTVGFVAAGLELCEQIENGEIEMPDRLFVGTGTMGTAVGLALGVALAGMNIEINAVRVSDRSIMNGSAMRTLLRKTITMMRLLDDSIPRNLEAMTDIRIRNGFYGPGYAQGTEATDEAIQFAQDQLGLTLETTYTGKTMAALLADLRDPETENLKSLYWHTYNSAPIDGSSEKPLDRSAVPEQFRRYFTG